MNQFYNPFMARDLNKELPFDRSDYIWSKKMKEYVPMDYCGCNGLESQYIQFGSRGTISFDTSQHAGAAGTVTSVTVTTSIGSGTNRLLIAGVGGASGSGQTISSVKLGTASFTQVSHIDANSLLSDIWVLINPASGASQSLTATFSAGVGNPQIGALAVAGADQITGINSSATATNSGASVSTTSSKISIVPTNTNSWIFGCVNSNQTLVSDSGGTDVWKDTSGSYQEEGGMYLATPTLGIGNFLNWAFSNTQSFVANGVEIMGALS